MLVLYRDGENIVGIDLADLGGGDTDNPFAALARADLSGVLEGHVDHLRHLTKTIGELLPAGPGGTRHIGTGTNFPEHALEANSTAVFQFPKFGHATPARTKVRAPVGILLDYEVEICARFDRQLNHAEDFDVAVKGFFLCGDFTTRNALINLADPDNLDSGTGFSDAKSGPDFFPTGPFLVVPHDWHAFVAGQRMTTSVNGAPRQDARGSEMTLNFRQLVQKAFADMDKPRFLYSDEFVKLTSAGAIPTSATVMSGTSEGTIFTPPSRGDLIEAVARYLIRGGPISGESFLSVARRTFIANELKGQHYLQPGDIVHHRSTYLGDILVEVTQ